MSERGPIPEDDYTIVKHESKNLFWRLISNTPKPGWKVSLGIERSGFLLHPGTVSLGCITVDRENASLIDDYRKIDAMLNRENGRNTLVVTP